MKATNTRLEQLFQKYLENDISESEFTEFSGYMDDPIFSQDIQELLGIAFQNGNETLSIGAIGRSRVLGNIFGVESTTEKSKRFTLWARIAGVAAAIAIVFFGIYLFRLQNKFNKESQYAYDVKPGTNSATLTLSSGKKIKLTDAVNGELAKEAGVVITKSANGELIYEIKGSETESNKINILSTAKGETYKVRLPDGSSVLLNSASSLKYPSSFNRAKNRIVELSGEGYFQIAKDKMHPFIVKTDKQEIEVLGTHFNVSSYPEEIAKTTLLEGVVKIDGYTFLKPGQQAIQSSKGVLVVNADLEMETAWMNGQFMFDGQNFKTIMNSISRWYNVEIIYEYEPYDLQLAGKISKYKNIQEVLRILEGTGDVHFKIQGKEVHVIR